MGAPQAERVRSQRAVALVLWSILFAAANGQEPEAISVTALAQWLDRGDAPVILDVRGRAAYLNGTIAGAIDAGQDPDGFLPDTGGGDVVLVLPDGVPVAPWRARLADFGYRVLILEGGMDFWRGQGLPEEKPEVSYTRPGAVPFVIPRGLCELNEPSHSFD